MYYITKLFNSIGDFLLNASLSCGVIISSMKCILHRIGALLNISTAEVGSIAFDEALC